MNANFDQLCHITSMEACYMKSNFLHHQIDLDTFKNVFLLSLAIWANSIAG